MSLLHNTGSRLTANVIAPFLAPCLSSRQWYRFLDGFAVTSYWTVRFCDLISALHDLISVSGEKIFEMYTIYLYYTTYNTIIYGVL